MTQRTEPSGELLEWVETGTVLFESAVGRLSDADLAAPSLLPDWRRAHVVAHIARNADALCNLLDWARTGVESPMYRDATQRGTDIEAGAQHAPADLRAELGVADDRLRMALAELPALAWTAQVRTARGRTVPCSEVPWMRIREVWIHAVDLDAGVDIEATPTDLARLLIDDVVTSSTERSDFPPLRLELPDGSAPWRTGPDEVERVSVRGDPAQVLAWLVGRGDGSGLTSSGPLPVLPPWL